jgi:hypothetical protein
MNGLWLPPLTVELYPYVPLAYVPLLNTERDERAVVFPFDS